MIRIIQTFLLKKEREKIELTTNCNMSLLNFGVSGLWVWSRIIIPAPPRVNMKLDKTSLNSTE